MFYVETSGSSYEMGAQLGRATALQIGALLDFVAKPFRRWDEATFNRVRAERMRYTEKLCPEWIEEIQGIADGSGIPFRWIYLMNFYASLRPTAEACTNIVFPNSPDGPILAKSNELAAHEGKYAGVRLFRPQNGPALLGSVFPGTVWFNCGINEGGLAIGGSGCSANVPAPAEALSPHVLHRYVLSKATTVKEAIAVLEKIPIPPWGVNTALVDRSGAAAVVEKAGEAQDVRWSKGEPIFCTNFSCTTELSARRIENPPVLKESRDRFAALERLTSGRPPSAALAREIMAYHQQPGAICRYSEDDPLKNETEFSSIFYPASGKAEFCFSKADRDPWRLFRL